MNRRTLLALAVAAAFLPAQQAFSHSNLKRAVPAARARLAQPPEAITLSFTQGIELKFSTITLLDGKGKPVATGTAEHVGNDAKTLRVSLPKLAPGTYKVDWAVLSVDTHRIKGDYSFTVNP